MVNWMYSDENQRTNIMKTKILFITLLLLIIGCSKEPINIETLVERDGVFYTNDTNKPYTGPLFSLHGNGKKKEELSVKDGLKNGETTTWFENGTMGEGTYKDGKLEGLWTGWYENGKKMSEQTYKNGKLEGLITGWYENGQKKHELPFKNGEVDGLSTRWYENGQWEETTWSLGKSISTKCWDEEDSECRCKPFEDGCIR
jgi:antitoxin component YwqK of YwqJK toxin-antitoxin module